eukprot:CAMPEP_0178741452 /NCGR_PEP_ID=MMETSP0744-20121128/5146_1 /TAXON_ID=913974 /ORGANISM="Nitzschia punctata, Strain CCMP561" /LENGTH=247 /DNA_ID=CAMNT_0020394323 /DNA_START=92 /DNA_END=835 /DNA_ORIENTATION=-
MGLSGSWSENEREMEKLMQSAEQEVAERGKNNGNIRGNDNKQGSVAGAVGAVRQQLHEGKKEEKPTEEILVMTTKYGKIRIVLRPDLSAGSVEYIHRLIDSGICRRCNLYRAEKPGILQGVMANPQIPVNEEKGSCPPGAETVHNDCPAWDAHCGCHGPVMTRGSVAWAAGQSGGPDFFIDNYKRPAEWWGTQHTNFGTIRDEESFQVIDHIFELPMTKSGGMTMLDAPIHFDLSLEPALVEEVDDI